MTGPRTFVRAGSPLGYSPGFDHLRALAAIVVVLHHNALLGGGYLGVDVFFVLSGYLITRLLVANRPTLGQFYWRRAKRLYPALLLLVAVCGYLGGPVVRAESIPALLYLTDYFPLPGTSWLMHTWSLSVEEHFYLIWPPILYWLLRTRTPYQVAGMMLGAAVMLLVWRLCWHIGSQSWAVPYYRLDTHCTGLALGCALGLMPHFRLPRSYGWAGLALIALAMLLFPHQSGYLMGLTVAEVGTALLIAGDWQMPFASRLWAYLGRLSYGLYLWHFPLVHIGNYLHLTTWPRLALSLGGGLVCAAVSYHTLEALVRAQNRKTYTDPIRSEA